MGQSSYGFVPRITTKYILAKTKVQPQEWIIYTDIDEFVSYPVHLRDSIDIMQSKQIYPIPGWFVDHITLDGSLPPITGFPSIFEQFPLGCHLSANWLKACPRKIMLCRAHVKVNAPHDTAYGVRFDICPIGQPQDYQVHHFK